MSVQVFKSGNPICPRIVQAQVTRRDVLRSFGLTGLAGLFPSLSSAGSTPTHSLSMLTATNSMFLRYIHWEITDAALCDEIPWEPLDVIIKANLDQDSGEAGGDPLNHGDDNRIEETISRIDSRIKIAQRFLNDSKQYNEEKINEVLIALGKVFHAVQDLVSHSNYVEIMTADGKYKTPDEVPPPNFLSWLKHGRPKGILTGTWDPKNKHVLGTEEEPTHERLNKDVAPDSVHIKHSPSSVKQVPGMPPHQKMFYVAKSVAISETKAVYKSFLQGLTKDGQNRWDKIANAW